MKKSNLIYIDGTFHHPIGYRQLIIIKYKDYITDLKIPAFYILINGKYQIYYEIILNSVCNILTDYNKAEINIKAVVSDTGIALINAIKKIFP